MGTKEVTAVPTHAEYLSELDFFITVKAEEFSRWFVLNWPKPLTDERRLAIRANMREMLEREIPDVLKRSLTEE